MANLNKKIIAQFEIESRQILNPAGELTDPTQKLPSWATKDHLIKLYDYLLLTRKFDKKAIALQRTGKLGTYPSVFGQEAINIGIGAAMQPEDIFCPYYRDLGTQLWRGVRFSDVLKFWGGDESGSCWTGPVQDFPNNVPIASQTLHAVGAATSLKIKNIKNRAVVVTIGDGGTSRGDFYEAMNVAGAWQLPVVFVINNNRWAISVPIEKQTRTQTLAQKAIAAGIPGVQIDGNDVLVVQDAVQQALARAYQGQGPTVIEAMTYRLGDHTTADDATRYREAKDLSWNLTQEPIVRFEKYLLNNQIITPEYSELCDAKIQKQMDTEIECYEASVLSKTYTDSKTDMLDFLYQTWPMTSRAMAEQYTELQKK